MLGVLAIEQIKETLKTAVLNKEIAGVNLLLIKDNIEIFYHEIGNANVEKMEAISRDSIFRLYSLTKPVTAAAIMLLMEQGKLDLYDRVDKYLPGFMGQKVVVTNEDKSTKLVEPNRPMNIMDLLNMTSGMRYGGDDLTGMAMKEFFKDLELSLEMNQAKSTIEAINLLGKIPLAFHPGESWEYGISADVLGAIIEVVSKMKYSHFLDKYFFKPLGMFDTGFYVPVEKQSRLVTTYEASTNLEEKSLVPFRNNHLGVINSMDKPPTLESGGAGLVSTIDDYKKFALMLLNHGTYNEIKILRKKSVEYLTTHVLTEKQQSSFHKWHTLAGHSYGNLMRIGIEPQKAGTLMSIGEYGWLGAYFANFPEEKLTMLLMMQMKDAGTTWVTRKLRNIIIGDC